MKMQYILRAAVAIGFALSTASFAAPKEGAPTPACEPGALKLATGPQGKGYDKIGQNLKAIGANVCIVNSEGSLDNLGLLSTKKAEVALATLDNMKTLGASDEAVRDLQVVLPLHSNYLHIATLAAGFNQTSGGEKKWGGLSKTEVVTTNIQITSASKLRGQRVGLVGSAQLLMRQIDKQHGLGLQIIDYPSDAAAIAAMKKGDVYAVASMAAWPHGVFDKMSSSEGITLIGFDLPPPQSFYQVKPLNYKTMGIYNVQMLGIQNVLVSRKFEGSRRNDVLALKQVVSSKLVDLKDGDYEPAWNEIRDINAKVDWPNTLSGPAPSTVQTKGKK